MDFKEIRNTVESEAKNSIGFAEAANKNSFMIGVSVALSKVEDHITKHISNLEKTSHSYQVSFEEVSKDMRTIVNILEKYSSYDHT